MWIQRAMVIRNFLFFRVLAGFQICMAFGFAGTAYSQAAPERQEELKVLELIVGTWDAHGLNHKSEWTPVERQLKGQIQCDWILKGKVLQGNVILLMTRMTLQWRVCSFGLIKRAKRHTDGGSSFRADAASIGKGNGMPNLRRSLGRMKQIVKLWIPLRSNSMIPTPCR